MLLQIMSRASSEYIENRMGCFILVVTLPGADINVDLLHVTIANGHSYGGILVQRIHVA